MQQHRQQRDNGIHEISYYADNEICMKEIRICVSASDWHLLKDQSCYRELVEFIRSLHTT